MFDKVGTTHWQRPPFVRDEENPGDSPAAGDDGSGFIDTTPAPVDNLTQSLLRTTRQPRSMNFASHRAALYFTILLSPALLPLVGCGRADYEAEVDKAIARLKIENQFKALEPTPTILAAWKAEGAAVGTKVTFRKPQLYGSPVKPFDSTTMNPRNTAEPLRIDRLKPPYLPNFPGFVQSWEKAPVAGRNDSVAVLYVGAQVAEPGLAERVLEELKAAIPDLPPETQWGDISVQTPEQGKTTKWKVLSFAHEQDFWHNSDVEAIKIKGTFLLLIREDQGRQVIIGCRWSETAGDQHQRRAEVLAAAGTVQVALNVKID